MSVLTAKDLEEFKDVCLQLITKRELVGLVEVDNLNTVGLAKAYLATKHPEINKFYVSTPKDTDTVVVSGYKEYNTYQIFTITSN